MPAMVEKMTAVWLILLTIIVCSAVPGILIYVTMPQGTNLLAGFPLSDSGANAIALRH